MHGTHPYEISLLVIQIVSFLGLLILLSQQVLFDSTVQDKAMILGWLGFLSIALIITAYFLFNRVN